LLFNESQWLSILHPVTDMLGKGIEFNHLGHYIFFLSNVQGLNRSQKCPLTFRSLSVYAEDHACVSKRLPAAGRHPGVQARALPAGLHKKRQWESKI
jgi:hypothetical protein